MQAMTEVAWCRTPSGSYSFPSFKPITASYHARRSSVPSVFYV